MQEKYIILQPTHSQGLLVPSNAQWSNDSFINMSRLLSAKLYHINDMNIDLNADIYHICNFDIELIEKEIQFAEDRKKDDAKIIVGFSQDLRFLHCDGLMNSNGVLWTELCRVSDIVTSGISSDLRMYGRYQDKVVDWGELLEPLNFSIPYDQRPIDFITSGPIGEQSLSFELELLLTIKEKYPEKRVVSCIHGIHHEKIRKLVKRYPQIEFPFNPENPTAGKPLPYYLRQSKVYCNPEIRPRPGRAAMDAFYCRVPFISSSWTYFSRLCPEFKFHRNDILEIVEQYDKILESDPILLIKEMEKNAEYDLYWNVLDRAKKKMGLI
jgi:hypothetical protein